MGLLRPGTDDLRLDRGGDPMNNALFVSDLSYVYPDGRSALHDVTLEVSTGERLSILGPNGAGKTTLMLHLNGTLTPSSGSITVDGLLVEAESLPTIRQKVGLVFQDSDDQLFMSSVLEDVMFGPRNLGSSEAEARSTATDALERVGAGHLSERSPHHLSGGERRRVAIATTLAMDPTILVLDEPTADLDPATRYELAELLCSLPVTQLVVTHDLAFAADVCGRSVVMEDGRIVADGATGKILSDSVLLASHRLARPVS